ncbi:hypothetical protein BE20_08590 [Sorangium cellulosum]|nr:hypothetical protein BE20_08590 [Sorangium cellulosum]
MARSFSATCGPDGLLHHLADLRSAVPSASGGVVFVSGQLAQRASGVAELVRSTWRGIPACVVPAAGVLSERGEIEGDTGASGVLWSGGQVTPFALPDRAEEPVRLLRETLARIVGRRSATAILFVRPGAFAPDTLEALASTAPSTCLFGAGTASGAAIGVTAQGELLEGATVGLAITGLAPPLVDASPAVRLLSGFHPIEDVSGGVVLRAGGRPALDLLSAATAALGEQPSPQHLVLAALADPADPRGAMSPPRRRPATRGTCCGRSAASIRRGAGSCSATTRGPGCASPSRCATPPPPAPGSRGSPGRCPRARSGRPRASRST